MRSKFFGLDIDRRGVACKFVRPELPFTAKFPQHCVESKKSLPAKMGTVINERQSSSSSTTTSITNVDSYTESKQGSVASQASSITSTSTSTSALSPESSLSTPANGVYSLVVKEPPLILAQLRIEVDHALAQLSKSSDSAISNQVSKSSNHTSQSESHNHNDLSASSSFESKHFPSSSTADTNTSDGVSSTGGALRNPRLVPMVYWYDSTHLATTEYYKTVVFGRWKYGKQELVKKGGFIEDKLGQYQMCVLKDAMGLDQGRNCPLVDSSWKEKDGGQLTELKQVRPLNHKEKRALKVNKKVKLDDSEEQGCDKTACNEDIINTESNTSDIPASATESTSTITENVSVQNDTVDYGRNAINGTGEINDNNNSSFTKPPLNRQQGGQLGMDLLLEEFGLWLLEDAWNEPYCYSEWYVNNQREASLLTQVSAESPAVGHIDGGTFLSEELRKQRGLESKSFKGLLPCNDNDVDKSDVAVDVGSL
jgi:hypothetical protein